MPSPGISYWLGSTIHSLFHSLCPLGLITINLTPCLSDAAARSAGLGEMFTKAVDHQHFDCGTPNGHYSLWPQWSPQHSVSMIPMQWLVPVAEPGKPTWRPVTLCLSFVLFFHLRQRCFLRRILFVAFVAPVDGFSTWIDLSLAHCFSLEFFCRLSLQYQSPGTYHLCSGVYYNHHHHHLILLSIYLCCVKGEENKHIFPPWLLLSWISCLRWWWITALWIPVLCK